MSVRTPAGGGRRLSPLKRTLYGAAAAGCVVLCIALALLVLAGPLLNSFVKPAVIRAFAGEYPAYRLHIADMTYSVFTNRLGADSVEVSTIDGAVNGSMGAVSVSGINWTPLLWGSALAPDNVAGAIVDARNIVLAFPRSYYEVRCTRVRIAVPESAMVAESLRIHPLAGDEEYFGRSKYRTTRITVEAPKCRVTGVAILALLQEGTYRARAILIQDPSLDVLINKDKPAARDTTDVRMPQEMLASMHGALQVDSLGIVNGRLKYGERFAAGATPALIVFDSMQVLAKGLANRGRDGAALAVHAEGRFMKAGTVNVRMSIPIGSPECSFQYSGSLGRMDLRMLNPFIEPAEQIRIDAGVLQSAAFEIDVVSGRASGTVRVVYRGLSLAAIDRHTGSDNGLGDRITSFVANTFTIRGTNVPDKAGAMKIGAVSYLRKRDDPFFGFTWVALRSGVQDVVGW